MIRLAISEIVIRNRHRTLLKFGDSISSYGTWALSRLTTANSGRVQPVLDIDYVLKNCQLYEESIRYRGIQPPPNINYLPELYEKAVKLRDVRDTAQRNREENSAMVAKLMRERKPMKDSAQIVKTLKDKGKVLRDELRTAVVEFNKVNDEIIDLVISLPNILDKSTPTGLDNKILDTNPVPENVELWSAPPNLEWTIMPGVGPAAEYPQHKATLMELELAGAAQGYLLANKFVETGNADFVESSVFDVAGMDPTQFIRIRESNISPKPENHASYLVGGASFPAFLVLFAQSLVRNPADIMPLRYFVIGRSYGRQRDSSLMYQRSAVQVFIACRDEVEMETEFDNLVDLTRSFLSHRIGISYTAEQIRAAELQAFERKRISFKKEGSTKALSHISAVGDHISKRLLCCFADAKGKDAKFMHLVTGRFLNLTDFLRPVDTKS